MIEALIMTKEGAGWSKGDIICVKKAGSIWGTEETKVHQLVEIDDPVLEARLETEGIISYPYKELEEKTIASETKQRKIFVTKTLSTKRINYDALAEKSDIENPSVKVPIIKGLSLETK